MGLGVTWSSGRGVWTRWPSKVHSNPNYSVILWNKKYFKYDLCSYRNIQTWHVFWRITISVLDNKCKYNQSVKQEDFGCVFKCKSQHVSNSEVFIYPITLLVNAAIAVVSWWNKVLFFYENTHPQEQKRCQIMLQSSKSVGNANS